MGDGELSCCEARTEAVTGATAREGRGNLRDLAVGPGGSQEEREEKEQ